jgi:hypothetical protein
MCMDFWPWRRPITPDAPARKIRFAMCYSVGGLPKRASGGFFLGGRGRRGGDNSGRALMDFLILGDGNGSMARGHFQTFLGA